MVLPSGLLDRDTRAQLRVLRLDDHLRREAGELVHLLPHRDALDDVAELHAARYVREDRVGEGIPLDQHRARLHLLAVVHPDVGAVDDRIALALATARVEDADLGVAVHHDVAALAVLNRAQVGEAHLALGVGLDVRLLDAAGRRTADVEGPHRELRARLSDRLGSDHADRLAEVHHLAAGEIAAVAQGAHAVRRLAGEHRADHHLLETGVLDQAHLLLVDLGARRHEHLVR